MSGYTHCRGCGEPLGQPCESIDGLCSGFKGHARSDCFTKAKLWAKSNGKPIDFAKPFTQPEYADAPGWHVAIDEWLAATR